MTNTIKLNPKQRAAAEFKDGTCSVVAVPGSGKTLTMTYRIGNLTQAQPLLNRFPP